MIFCMTSFSLGANQKIGQCPANSPSCTAPGVWAEKSAADSCTIHEGADFTGGDPNAAKDVDTAEHGS